MPDLKADTKKGSKIVELPTLKDIPINTPMLQEELFSPITTSRKSYYFNDATTTNLVINGTLTYPGASAGTDNTVLILKSDNNVITDEIDPKVWAIKLVDYTGTPANNQLAIFTDVDTLEGDANVTYDGTSFTLGTGKNFKIGTTQWNTGDDIDASKLSGTIPADVLQTEWDTAYTHIGESGASHTYIDQSVVSGAAPTFTGTNFTGIDISTGTNLAGGSGITLNDDTLDLDINSLAAATIVSGDFVPFWDITATATNKKTTFANFEAALTHDNLIAGTIADHDTTATGANLTELTDGSDTTLHDHDGISENTTARHAQGTDTALGTMVSDIDMDNTYQVVNLQAPAANGEAIRQTAKITETNMEAAHDHVSADGSSHTYIDQDLQQAASPTFVGLTLSGSLTDGTESITIEDIVHGVVTEEKVVWSDDFLGEQVDDRYDEVIAGSGTISIISGVANGIVRIDTAAAEDNTLKLILGSSGAIKSWDQARECSFEVRFKTSNATGNNIYFHLDKDSNETIRARIDTSANLLMTVDGGSGTSSINTDTGKNISVDTWYVLRVETSSTGVVNTWLDGDSCFTSASEAANTILDGSLQQFEVQVNDNGAAQTQLDIDYWKIWQNRI